MKKKRMLIMAGVAVCLTVVAAYAATSEGGLVGEWETSTAELLTLLNTGVPVFLAPEVRVTVNDDNTLQALVIPPLVGWAIKGVVDGTYTKDDSGSVNKMTVTAGMASVRVLFITLPIQDLASSVPPTTVVYKIQAQDTLYVLPTTPELLAVYEAKPTEIPWQGSADGSSIALKFERN
jgi:hypothetical protein